jgi:hypothetical protein
VRRAIDAWSQPRLERAARALVLGAAALLFLEAAGTIHAVYTLRLSYLACAVACVVGAPFVLRGWARCPWAIRWSGAALVAAYVAAAVFSDPLTLPGQPRTGAYRMIAYVVDLLIGVSTLGLVVGLFPARRNIRRLVHALVLGAGVAAAYGIYQWPARHFGWPLADVNNTIDSNGITSGIYQGPGLLGWERVRGTFIEPHFFGDYLAALLPLAAAVGLAARGRAVRTGAFAIAAGCGAALALTASAPSAAILVGSALVAAAAYLVGQGRPAGAAVAGGLAAGAFLLGPYVLTTPALLERATGRSQADLAATIAFRTETWSRAARIWTARPVLGWGPGQSSVQLAAQTDLPRGVRPRSAGKLQSAQGTWAASLIDAGVVGFGAWILLLGSAVGFVVVALARRATPLTLGTAAAAVAATMGNEITSDRLDLRTWLLLGLALATALAYGRPEAGNAGEPDAQAEPGSGGR